MTSTTDSHHAFPPSREIPGHTGGPGVSEECDAQPSDAQLSARLAEYGAVLRPPPGEAAWPAGWLPGDEPVEIRCGLEGDPHAQRRVFDTHARVRFLDALAGHGNVRAAAARVGVSHETAYRARRRYEDFAYAWDAALVHARARAEAELVTRALDGVAVPVFLRGEHVATWRKQDARYLLAHLERLDRRIAGDPDAVMRAGRFDQMLAAMAGNTPLEEFAEAACASRGPGEDVPPDLPPSRQEYLAYARYEALDALESHALEADIEDETDCGDAEDAEDSSASAEECEAEAAAIDAADARAQWVWDQWNEAGAALLGQVLDPVPGQVLEGKETARTDAPDGTAALDPAPDREAMARDCKPPETAAAARSPSGKPRPQERVTCVNTDGAPGGEPGREPGGEPGGAPAGRTMCSPLALSSGSAENYRVPDVLSGARPKKDYMT